ncbi:MAG: endonuclease domain-containing protein [Cytophagaceae bacterium]
MEKLHNRIGLKEYRKELRNNLTTAEATLWIYLQKKKLQGKKFRRQHSVGNYILDFYCPSEKLAIELDGAHHFTPEGRIYDKQRTRFLADHNIRVIRFENDQVLHQTDYVLDRIRQAFS